MKKNSILAVAAISAVTALSFASCGGNKKAQADSATVDTIETVETETTVSDAPYGAAYFTNPDNQAGKGTPSDSIKQYNVTESGLKYVTVTEGTGASPKATDQVKVHYTGTLLDGTVFDSSVERGEPITFPLGGVIKGWTEGLQLMKEGGTTIFYIPSELAYGEQGTPGGPIPPNAPLIFEVQLIKVNPDAK